MKILIRKLQGDEITLEEIESNHTVQYLKEKLEDKENIDPHTQWLGFNGQLLEGEKLLSDYDITEESILDLSIGAQTAAEQRPNTKNGVTVAGGNGQGKAYKQLSFPCGLFVDGDQTIVIADWGNHRIVQWKAGDRKAQVVAGGLGQGSRLNQLNSPTDVLVDVTTNTLIIADHGNKRVLRWSRRDVTTEGEVLLENISCWGLAMDNNRNLYVSDNQKHEVKRYILGEREGILVAGGHGGGITLNKLNQPSYIFVDSKKAVYVSDTLNHRVMKWANDKEGTVVARGFPRGIFVDKVETVYVADYGNHCIKSWPKGATNPIVIAGGDYEDDELNRSYFPVAIFIDQQGKLYAADSGNHRVEQFSLQQAN